MKINAKRELLVIECAYKKQCHRCETKSRGRLEGGVEQRVRDYQYIIDIRIRRKGRYEVRDVRLSGKSALK